MRLSGRCFAVIGLGYLPPWTVNAGFITGDETTLIVDTGANSAAASTIHGYASTARPSNRLLVLDTERHFDHIGGNGYFRDLGIDVYGHASIQRTTTSFARRCRIQQRDLESARRSRHESKVFYYGTQLANPNHPITEDSRMDLGNCEIDILLTPGHTPGNISVCVPRTEFCIAAIAWSMAICRISMPVHRTTGWSGSILSSASPTLPRTPSFPAMDP